MYISDSYGSITVLCFFFFKQKTAYQMRISDWISDVCSSVPADGSSFLAAEYPGPGHHCRPRFVTPAVPGCGPRRDRELAGFRILNGGGQSTEKMLRQIWRTPPLTLMRSFLLLK